MIIFPPLSALIVCGSLKTNAPPPKKKEVARLVAVALFEDLCSCWRKCAAVGLGSELFFPQALLGGTVGLPPAVFWSIGSYHYAYLPLPRSQ